MNMEFKALKEAMETKYAASIGGISKYNNVDMGVAFDMFLSNARSFAKEDYTEIYKGAGIIDLVGIIADIEALDASRRV